MARPVTWVVDNGSRPPGIDPIRHEFPEVRVLQSPTNLGFAGGSNLVLERSAQHRQTLHIYYVVRNRFLFVRKHYPRRRGWLYARWALRAAVTALAALCRGNGRRARAVTLGVLDGVRGRFGGQNERILRHPQGRPAS